MTENQHVSRQFDEDLARLRTQVLQMGGLIESQISLAIEAYASCDITSVQTVVDTDRMTDELEKAIDDDCTHIIARRQPTAVDLRLVFGTSKIVTDLERAGDEAKKVAKCVRRICESGHIPSQFGIGIRHLAEAALLMVRQALDAYARLDTEQARTVIRADENVDSDFKSMLRELITHMMEDPRTITVCMEVISIARSVERIGDHAKNISEQVIFVAEGRDIRHAKGGSAQ
jgi:phosphate transport system protein